MSHVPLDTRRPSPTGPRALRPPGGRGEGAGALLLQWRTRHAHLLLALHPAAARRAHVTALLPPSRPVSASPRRHLVVTPGLTAEVGPEPVHPAQEAESSPSSLEPPAAHIEKPRPTKGSETLRGPSGRRGLGQGRRPGLPTLGRRPFSLWLCSGGQADLGHVGTGDVAGLVQPLPVALSAPPKPRPCPAVPSIPLRV